MNQDLQNQRVFVNRELEKEYPLMASGIYTNDSMQLILMLWGMPLEKMNLAETNRLRIVGYLIQNAMLRAKKYLDVLRNQRYLPDSKILNEDAFRQLIAAFLHARDEQLTVCALLKVNNVTLQDLNGIKGLERNLRQSDYLGVLRGNIYILLSNTDEINAQSVINRLQKNGIETSMEVWHGEDRR